MVTKGGKVFNQRNPFGLRARNRWEFHNFLRELCFMEATTSDRLKYTRPFRRMKGRPFFIQSVNVTSEMPNSAAICCRLSSGSSVAVLCCWDAVWLSSSWRTSRIHFLKSSSCGSEIWVIEFNLNQKSGDLIKTARRDEKGIL